MGKQPGHTADTLGLIGHADEPFLPGGAQLDGKGLDNGHQSHIGIGRHSDSADVLTAQHQADQNGGGAIGRTDDTGSRRIHQVKAQQRGHGDGEEHAELSRRAKEQQLGVGKHRSEVDHSADTDKKQQRHGFRGVNAHFKEPIDDSFYLTGPCHGLGEHPGHGDIDQDGAKAHGQKQRRFHFLLHRQPDEQAADDIHHHLLPSDREDPFC